MARFDALIETAKRLIEKNGEPSTLVRTTPGAPSDPTKPWEPGTPTVTSTPVSTVWLNESILRRGTLVKEGEIFAILAAKDLSSVPDPSLDHLVRSDGTRYAIVAVEPLSPNGQKIIYEIRARK